MKTLNNISSEKFANQVFNEIDENFDDVKAAIDTLEQSGGGGGSSSRTLMMAALGASTTADGGTGIWHDGTSIYKIISRILGATDYRNYAGSGQQMRISIAGTQVNSLLADATYKNSDFVFLQCGWNDITQYAENDVTKIGDADAIIAYYKANDLGHESDASFLTNEIYDTSLGWLFKGIYRLLAGLKESAVLVVCSPIKSSVYNSTFYPDAVSAWVSGIRKIVLYFGRYQFESTTLKHDHVDKWFKRIRYVDCKNLPILDEDITMYYDRHLDNVQYVHPNNQGCAIVAHYIVSQFWRNGLYQSVVTSGGGGGGTETDPVFKASPAYGITSAKITEWDNKYTKPSGGIPASDLANGVIPNVNDKQNTLVSGENIKTIDGQSVLGSGNIPINDSVFGKMQNGEFLQGTYSTNGWAYNMNPVTPQVNKTYVDVASNTIYRYSGSAYVALVPTKTSNLVNDSGFIDKPLFYGTCETAAASMPKVCSVETFPTLTDNGVTHAKDGTIIAVKFTASDTNADAAPTLNVNGIGAKGIMYNNAIVTSTAKNTTIAGTAKMIAYYRYDSSLDNGNGAWEYLGKSVDSNTTYSSMSQAEVTAGTGTTARTITPKLLRDNFYTEGEVDNLLDEKQDAISDLASIRSGASAGSSAYQKPASGIPASDLANGVIPNLSGYAKFVLCQDEAAYNAIANKDSGTLYLIPES